MCVDSWICAVFSLAKPLPMLQVAWTLQANHGACVREWLSVSVYMCACVCVSVCVGVYFLSVVLSWNEYAATSRVTANHVSWSMCHGHNTLRERRAHKHIYVHTFPTHTHTHTWQVGATRTVCVRWKKSLTRRASRRWASAPYKYKYINIIECIIK